MAYYLNGKQYRQSTGTADPEAAEKVLRNKIKEVHAAQIGARNLTTPRASKMRISEMLGALRDDYELRGKLTDKTRFHIARVENDFGDRIAVQISNEEITKYIKDRQAKGGKGSRPASINRTMQLLGQAFKIAIRNKHLNASDKPYTPHLDESDNVRTGFLEPAQFEAICEKLPADLCDFAKFSYATGMRKGEASSLRWENVHKDTIVLAATDSKNKTGRVIPMAGAELAGILKRRRAARRVTINGVTQIGEGSDFIFSRVLRGKLVPVRSIRKAWAEACTAAGFPKMLWHDLRRSAVRNMVDAGVPPVFAKKISGHKTDQLFERYNIVVEKQLAEALSMTERYRMAAKAEAASGQVVSIAR
jgi:integrase